MTLSEFQEWLLSLGWKNFEQFVVDVLVANDRFGEVRHNAMVGGHQIDIEAVESDAVAGSLRHWFLDVKYRPRIGLDVLRETYGLWHALRKSAPPNTQFALVVSGHLSAAARQFAQECQLEIWDAQTLLKLTPPEVAQSYFHLPVGAPREPAQSKAESFRESLTAMPKGKPHANEFQRLISDIFEYLFCPPLEAPRYEMNDADARNRRDMIFENTSPDGWWAHIRSIYAAHYVVVDAKNYSATLKKRPVLDIAHYLKPYGCGLFGILVAREGPAEAAMHAIREHWIGGQKMMVVLSDSDILEMLQIKSTGGRPEEIVRERIADFRMKL